MGTSQSALSTQKPSHTGPRTHGEGNDHGIAAVATLTSEPGRNSPIGHRKGSDGRMSIKYARLRRHDFFPGTASSCFYGDADLSKAVTRV
jgi:hypothetical protein